MPSAFDPALAVAVALAAGVTAQVVARLLDVPGIVLLLGLGVLLGPEVLGIVQPAALGPAMHTLVGLAVSVILFEGGMSLDLRRLRHEAGVIQRLIWLGAILTCAGGTLVARGVMGWGWKPSLLFGALVIVTGPTVITPLLRRIGVNKKVHTVLEAEGVLIDAVGALFAVVALEMVIGGGKGWLALGVEGLARRWGVGLLVGAIGGFVIGIPLKRRWIPEGLTNIYALGFAIAVFAVSSVFAKESGILAVIVAGMIVGNLHAHVERELLEFKEQLTVLFVGMLFILLAADVKLAEVVGLGARGLLAVALLMFVVRPVTVFASTAGSDLTRNERAFIAWLGPRGIVAAAVSSLFAESLTRAGMSEGSALRALVFLVIACTVVLQGLSGPWVARWLGVKRKTDVGVLILGAQPLARAVGSLFRARGEEVVLLDVNAEHCRVAQEEGFRVVFGNALEERVLRLAEPESRRAVLGLTHNEGVNLLFARRLRELFKCRNVFVAVHRGRLGVSVKEVERVGAQVLFGGPIELDRWTDRSERGGLEPVWRVRSGPAPAEVPGAPGGGPAPRRPPPRARAARVQPHRA